MIISADQQDSKESGRRATLSRPRLLRRMRNWSDYRVIFVHAPAGFGKTRFVSQWVETLDPTTEAVAWLMLDETDRDPVRFLTHLSRVLEPAFPGAQRSVELWLTYQQPAEVLVRLMEGLLSLVDTGTAANRLVLVLDDIQFATTADSEALLAVLLEVAPDWLTTVLVTRHASMDILTPLHLAGQVLEIRPDELRLDRDELSEYLSDSGLDDWDAGVLDRILERTEGWFAALQLVRVSLAAGTDINELLSGIRGASRWLAAYLSKEVIDRLSDSERQFLLETAIPEQFNASLAAEVSGADDAYRLIDEIQAKDLFLTALDGRTGWYRYHPLFRELLLHELRRALPATEVAHRHRKAAHWLSANGLVTDAVTHYTAAGDHDRAAAILGRHIQSVILAGDTHEAQRLLDTMPAPLRQSPLLCLQQVTLDSLRDRSDRFDAIGRARLAIEAAPVTDRNKQMLWDILAIHEAGALFQHRDPLAAKELLLNANPDPVRMDALTQLFYYFMRMHLFWLDGQVDESLRCGQKALNAAQRADFPVGTLAVQREIARKALYAGQGDRAARLFEHLLATETPTSPMVLSELFWIFVHAAENAYWMDDLARAGAYHRSAQRLAEQIGDESWVTLVRFYGLFFAPGQTDVSTTETDDIYAMIQQDARRVATVRNDTFFIRLLIRQGRPARAVALAESLGVFPPSKARTDKSPLAIEGLNAAIAARQELAAARLAITDMLSEVRPLRTHRFQTLRLLILAAWLHVRLGEEAAAATYLDEALSLSEESGYIRPILDVPELYDLLGRSPHPYGRRVLSRWPAGDAAAPPTELTLREIEVLRLLKHDYAYKEIATEMNISLNTVRTHVRQIYRKLGVTRRSDAILKAIALGIL
jgi:LuxR family maltose regulon positive regulatory protein